MTLVKSRYTSLVANPASCDPCKTGQLLVGITWLEKETILIKSL